MVRPDSSSVASWRVMRLRTAAESPRAQVLRARSRARTSPTSEGRSPFARSWPRAWRAVSASTTPETLRPLASSAWYWKACKAVLFARDAHDLFEADHALLRPAHAVVAKRAHAARRRMGAQRLLRRAIVDQLAQVVVDGEELIDAGAAAIAGLVAGGAALRGVERLAFVEEGLAAFHAHAPHQALRADADQARGEQKRLDAHIDQPRDGAHRIVGVKGGEDQMAGQARLHRNLRGLQVADLADHHHVRVLAQDGSQR